MSKKNDRIIYIKEGSGGYGNPFERDPQKVLEDGDVLSCKALIKCGCISVSDFKPKALPEELFNGMKSLLE